MKLQSKTLGVIILVVLFGGIFGSSALDLWKTQSSKVPNRLQEGEAVGEYDPEEIRGSYQFGNISGLFDIPLNVMNRAFGLPAGVDAASFRCGDLEMLYGDLGDDVEIGTGSVKFFVALYSGIPYELPEDDYLPEQAVEILKNHASLTEEQIVFLDAHALDVSDIQHDIEFEVEEETHDEGGKVVQGQTTFANLLDWGVPEETIASIIGDEVFNPLSKVRDYCDENGLEFSTIKSALQAEVDSR
ncbi:MAG: hypothetical protein U9Q82_08100 [Chloroflexota bacterium]|nr:hypothetical protein [Chloroflexota bacterium]